MDQYELPMVALRGLTVVPNMIIHFDLSRDMSKKAVERSLNENQKLFLVAQKDENEEKSTIETLYHIGTVANIKQVTKLPNNIERIMVEGALRAKLLEVKENEGGYITAVIEEIDEDENDVDAVQEEALKRSLREVFATFVRFYPKVGKSLGKYFEEENTLRFLVNQVLINTPFSYEKKQEILEIEDLGGQCEELVSLIMNEAQIAAIRTQLAVKVKEKIDKNQKDYILREQLEYIQDELGGDDKGSEAAQFEEAVDKLKAGDEVKEKIRKEIARFKKIVNSSSESAVERGYIETLLELPWDKASRDNNDITHAEEILERDHYGLEKVKERIIEYLAVRSLTHKGDTPILCLVGPPGTGKTSIAKSIAEALRKKYVRICLGGVRDEAEIRGHRRTYVGAMPGRIRQA